jgi:hypothetical protein
VAIFVGAGGGLPMVLAMVTFLSAAAVVCRFGFAG